MKTVTIRNIRIGKELLVSLSFPYDEGLKRIAKTIPGAAWYPARRALVIPHIEQALNDLLKVFKGKAWPDYAGFEQKTDARRGNYPTC